MTKKKACSPLLMAVENQLALHEKSTQIPIIQRFKQYVSSKKARRLARQSVSIFVLSALLTEPAYAGTGIPTLDTVIQFVVDVLTGSLARLIAILTVINIGYKCKTHEMTIQKGAIEAGGIGLVMGAAYVVDAWGIF